MSDAARARRIVVRAFAPLVAAGALLGVTASAQAESDATGHHRHASVRTRPAAVVSSAVASASGSCSTAESSSGGALRSRAICLVNDARESAGLHKLRADVKLTRAATSQALDMIAHDYFAHARSGGPTFSQRLAAAGFHAASAGEAIAYGCGSRASAQSTVQSWLDSPPHRAVLLSPSYRRVGIGIVAGSPTGCSGGASTWVLDAGER